jgi:ribose transport system ATP-binding protein
MRWTTHRRGGKFSRLKKAIFFKRLTTYTGPRLIREMEQGSLLPTEEPAVISVKGLTKRFAGVLALDNVDLEVRRGEIHGLLGENGSGKSTLIKVLAGYHDVDDGEIEVSGRLIKLPLAPGRFRELGLAFVYQDLGLIPNLSVLENLRLPEILSSGAYISWSAQRKMTKELFERYGLPIDPSSKIEDLRPVEKAQLAIVRAIEGLRHSITQNDLVGGLLVLDEPTVFLPLQEVEILFRLIHEIAASGSSVLLVSHDLDEVKKHCDRITVLRDGRRVGTVSTGETSKADLVRMIVGKNLDESISPRLNKSSHKVVASVQGLTSELLDSIDLEVSEGEVLGLTGLMGSGFDDTVYYMFGAKQARSGNFTINGKQFDLTEMTPVKSLKQSVVLIPADRNKEACIGTMSITENVNGLILDKYVRRGFLQRGQLRRQAAQMMETFDIRPRDPKLSLSALSGGNQQKVVLAKWLQVSPSLMLLHEPTQGVDVGARQQILTVIRNAVNNGMSVVCASNDYEQLELFCDRVLVFDRGRIVGELVGLDISKERIIKECYKTNITTSEKDNLMEGISYEGIHYETKSTS